MIHRVIVSLSWTIVLGWMVFIFVLSAQPAEQSGQLSESITGFIVGSSTDDDVFYILNHVLRKNAHLFTYLILGILVVNALIRSRMSRNGAVFVSFGICVLFACSDEFHQLFVAGRGAQVKDVLIDSAGALAGIGIYSLIVRVMKR